MQFINLFENIIIGVLSRHNEIYFVECSQECEYERADLVS